MIDEFEKHRKGLTTALRIMDAWGVGDADQACILNIDRSLLGSLESLDALTPAQLLRISYLLNIHTSLRELFQNPKNHSGFMRAVNHNPPYCGQTPLHFVLWGEADSLRQVFESLEQLKHR